MTAFMDNLNAVSEAAEAVGVASERVRILAAIDELAPLNLDEIVYRERVLAAIGVTTPIEAVDNSRGKPASEAGSTVSTAAAARSTADGNVRAAG